MTTVTERLVTKLASLGRTKASRRSFIGAATLAGTAMALDPIGYLTKPQDAYASVCGPGAECSDGWSAMCCSINGGHNTCPPNTYAGGWWKADRSSWCGGAARYYIDCNAQPGYHFTCHCNQTNCDHRYVACNIFRYGQCNTQIKGVTAVVCRQISCRPPWQIYPGHCGTSSATDNNTLLHSAPCLTKANTFPNLVTFPATHTYLSAGHYLWTGAHLTSLDRHTELLMNKNGNLEVRNQNGVVWSTHTSSVAPNGYAFLRYNGELVVLSRANKVVWSSHSGTPGIAATLKMNNNGDVTIVHGTTTVWHTGTHTP